MAGSEENFRCVDLPATEVFLCGYPGIDRLRSGIVDLSGLSRESILHLLLSGSPYIRKVKPVRSKPIIKATLQKVIKQLWPDLTG